MRSVQSRLSLWLSLAILAMAIAAGIVSFAAAFREANEFQDDLLRRISLLFDADHLPAPTLAGPENAAVADEEERVIVEYLPPEAVRGVAPAISKAGIAGLTTVPHGISTLRIGRDSYRAFSRALPDGGRIIVAQETGMRDEIARDSALRTLFPLVIFVPVMVLIIAILVRGMFKPIAALSEEIDARGDNALHALRDEHVPAEVHPFVVAINRLLGRVAQSMDMQRRFVADAAHELRSPMTALSLQAERLEQAAMSEEARTRLLTLRRGIERSRALLEQLLSLARVQAEAPPPTKPISVRQAYRQVLEDLMPLADARHIDIGIVGEADAMVLISEIDLQTLLKNLVDNAIRYTPEYGRVDMSVREDAGVVMLEIADSGPGIEPDQRDRVFDAFYRTPGTPATGSGLGLSIVQAILQRTGASLSAGYVDETARRGWRVSIRFSVTPQRDD